MRVNSGNRTGTGMNEADIDRRACQAIDRLAATMGKSLDVQAVRAFVALHTGRNPHANGELDPNAKLMAANEKLSATVADLECRLKAATARATMADQECREVRHQLAGTQRLIETLSKGRAIPRKARRKRRKRKAATPNGERMQAKRDARARYINAALALALDAMHATGAAHE
jgi:hypothetical protein